MILPPVFSLPGSPARIPSGHASIAVRRSGTRTVLAEAAAASPLRLLTPRNHGLGAWVYLASLGGGLVDGDHIAVRVDAAEGTTCVLGTQATTKVYRSPAGCSQRLQARVADGAALAFIPDPVVCFAGARYSQELAVEVAPEASLLLLDGYGCGRAARGERWRFASFRSRTTIHRSGRRAIVDATWLDPVHGDLPRRMGRFDVVLSLIAIGPRFADVGTALRELSAATVPGTIVAVSPLGTDATIVRIAAECFELAFRPLRMSFAALADALGDDPFARKW
jgi:urease accessory protein